MNAEILENFQPIDHSQALAKHIFNQKKKILIIDDEFDVRICLAELLVNEGYQVATAKDGAEGISHLLSTDRVPDLILLDLVMPVDADEFRAEFSKLSQVSSIPLMLMTGHHIEDVDLNGIKAFLQKPFDYFEVLDSIAKTLKNI